MALTDKQKAFVDEYLVDLNASAAALRAGYSAKSAGKLGHQLMNTEKVQEAIAAAQAARSARVQVTQDWVVEKLVENVDRAMTAVPAYDKDGEPTGEYTYQGAVANRSLELLGKHLGMFKEKMEVTGEDGGALQVVIRKFHFVDE